MTDLNTTEASRQNQRRKIEALELENASLRSENRALKKAAGLVVTTSLGVFLGPSLVTAGRKLEAALDAWSRDRENVPFPISELTAVGIAGTRRFLRVGIFAMIAAAIPVWLLLNQNALLKRQNTLIDAELGVAAFGQSDMIRAAFDEANYSEARLPGAGTTWVRLSRAPNDISVHHVAGLVEAAPRLALPGVVRLTRDLESETIKLGALSAIGLLLDRGVISEADLARVAFQSNHALGGVWLGYGELTYLRHVPLEGSLFTRSQIGIGLRVKGARLAGATFDCVDLMIFDATGLDLRGATFWNVTASVLGIEGTQTPLFPKAVLTSANLAEFRDAIEVAGGQASDPFSTLDGPLGPGFINSPDGYMRVRTDSEEECVFCEGGRCE